MTGTMVFCTLFDSYYLDKGLTLYHSLKKVSDQFKLYIFCFDDSSYEVLKDLKLEHAVIVHHSEIEDAPLPSTVLRITGMADAYVREAVNTAWSLIISISLRIPRKL